MSRVFLFLLLLLSTKSFAQSCNDLTTTYTGDGTYYGYDGGGNCGYPYPGFPSMTAAMNASQYNGSATCGACAEVTGELGTIVLRIDDQCPECQYGDLDLTKEAFVKIADTLKGRVPISWHFVECPIAGNIRFYFTGNPSPEWYIQIQVRNSKFAITKMEFLRNDVYEEITKASYNFFIADKGLGGEGPFTFRITNMVGEVLFEQNVVFKDQIEIDGTKQFPSCAVTSVNRISKSNEVTFFQEDGGIYITNNSKAEYSYSLFSLLGQKIDSGTIQGNSKITLGESLNHTIAILKVWNKENSFVRKIIR